MGGVSRAAVFPALRWPASCGSLFAERALAAVSPRRGPIGRPWHVRVEAPRSGSVGPAVPRFVRHAASLLERPEGPALVVCPVVSPSALGFCVWGARCQGCRSPTVPRCWHPCPQSPGSAVSGERLIGTAIVPASRRCACGLCLPHPRSRSRCIFGRTPVPASFPGLLAGSAVPSRGSPRGTPRLLTHPVSSPCGPLAVALGGEDAHRTPGGGFPRG